MRKMSQPVKDLLMRDDTDFVYLLKLTKADSTFILETNNITAVTAVGYTFNPNNKLQSIEPPKLSTVADRESYKITYIDPNREKISMFEEGLSGAKVTVWAAFRNTTGAPMSATGGLVAADDLLLNDLLIAYQGIVDTQGYTINPANGTVIAVIECASPLAGLSVVKSLYNSKASMNERNRADTAFDQVHEGSSKLALLWGKKEPGYA